MRRRSGIFCWRTDTTCCNSLCTRGCATATTPWRNTKAVWGHPCRQTAPFACLSLQKSSTSLFRFFWEIISRKKPLLYVNSWVFSKTKSASDRNPMRFLHSLIIPYQELLGNYDPGNKRLTEALIIPYQELLGNYDWCRTVPACWRIIPYQELLGNYDTGTRK